MLKPIIYLALVAQGAHALNVVWQDSRCDVHRAVIEEELQLASDMALAASKDVEKGKYYENMFGPTSRQSPTFADEVKQTFEQIAKMVTGDDPANRLEVTCDPNSRFCKQSSFMAHMSDAKMIMNFCNQFFATSSEIKGTNSREKDDCQSMTLREAHRSKAAVLVHELTHTRAAMLYEDPAMDYAYGFAACYRLALGVFDRSCVPYKGKNALCPDKDGKEGVCKDEIASKNADNYAFVAAGIYYTDKCKRAIPLPPLPDPIFVFNPENKRDVNSAASEIAGIPVASHTLAANLLLSRITGKQHRNSPRQTSDRCEGYDDYIMIDKPGDEIEGYVHFGDSYGAGMGTGTTSGDKCRVGENNFGDLLYKSWGDNKMPFEKKVCSGDTTTGLDRQIEEWKDPGKANVGTVSIGGNDLGFSDMAWYCILTPNTGHFGFTNRADCINAENKARRLMRDEGANGLKAKLKASYIKILQKSGRPDFHLYVTTYAAFFNYDTSDCNKSSFHYWWGGYNPSSDFLLRRIVHLTKNLRHEIDDLVMDLNKLIGKAVDEANAEHGGNQQIHFVDVNPRFTAHRWCEQGDWHEPAPEVDSTWFFLSGWPDVSIEGSEINSIAIEEAEASALISSGRIPLPDANNCKSSLDANADPYERAMCYMAVSIKQHPDGPAAQALNQANNDIKDGNVSSQDIGYFTPTRQIKAFHPRSPGMVAYRDALIEGIEKVGQV